MNIFFIEHKIPEETIQQYARRIAQSHCDLHQKQILESWQMLNTNCNILGIETDNPSIAYRNHPCTKWARSSLGNWQFLYHLAEELALEFQFRNSKKDLHKSWIRISENVPYDASGLLTGGLTPPPMAMPDTISESCERDPVEAYRKYYNTHKAFFSRRTKKKGMFNQELVAYKISPSTWKNRDLPEWWNPVSLDTALKCGYVKATNQYGKQFSLHANNDFIL